MKKFFSNTAFLYIGGILGILQQVLGRLYSPYALFNWSGIMGGLSFWAAFILLLLCRKNKTPGKQFRDIFLLFLGMDFFYYLWVFLAELHFYHTYHAAYPDTQRETAYFFQKSRGEVFDFIKWTTIGLAAGIWGFFTARFRERGWNRRYLLMLAPLFLVMLLETAEGILCIFRFLMQENKSPDAVTNGIYYAANLDGLLTSITCLSLCGYFYLKQKLKKSEIKA